MKKALTVLLSGLFLQPLTALAESENQTPPLSQKSTQELPSNFDALLEYLKALSKQAPALTLPNDPSPDELLGLLEQALELPALQAHHQDIQKILKTSQNWLNAERLDFLEERTDIIDFDLNQLNQRFDHFDEELPFKVFGSLALRSCSMMNSQADIVGSTLQTRLGVGVRGRFHSDWDYGLRALSIPNDNFNLSWFPFDNNANLMRTPINLDRYFIRWRPKIMSGFPELSVSVGKALNPLPESQLLFDEDVSFNGLQESIRWKNPIQHLKELRFDFGQHPLINQGTFITSSLFSAKLRSDWQWGDWQLRGGSSYAHYLGTDAFAPLNLNQGYLGAFSSRNRLNSENNFTSDFQILNAFGRLSWSGLSFPITLLGDYAHNFGAQDLNNGGLIGLQLGQLRKSGDWQFNYAYRYMQQDFNLSLMIDDFYSGTDVAGHTFRLGSQITDHNAAHLTLVTRQSLSRPESGHLFILYTSIQQSF